MDFGEGQAEAMRHQVEQMGPQDGLVVLRGAPDRSGGDVAAHNGEAQVDLERRQVEAGEVVLWDALVQQTSALVKICKLEMLKHLLKHRVKNIYPGWHK